MEPMTTSSSSSLRASPTLGPSDPLSKGLANIALGKGPQIHPNQDAQIPVMHGSYAPQASKSAPTVFVHRPQINTNENRNFTATTKILKRGAVIQCVAGDRTSEHPACISVKYINGASGLGIMANWASGECSVAISATKGNKGILTLFKITAENTAAADDIDERINEYLDSDMTVKVSARELEQDSDEILELLSSDIKERLDCAAENNVELVFDATESTFSDQGTKVHGVFFEEGKIIHADNFVFELGAGRMSDLPAPIVNVETGETKDYSTKQLLNLLDTFEGDPGVVTEELQKLVDGPPDHALVLAVLIERNVHPVLPRRLVEVAAWAKFGAGFPFDLHPLLKANVERNGYSRFRFDLNRVEELSLQAFDALWKRSVIEDPAAAGGQKKQRVLDLASGAGFVAVEAAKKGCDIIAVEPISIDPHKIIFGEFIAILKNMTAEKFAESEPLPQFDLIMVNNYHLNEPTESDQFIAAVCRMLAPGGRVFMGIPPTNPELLSGIKKLSLRPKLEKHTDVKVEYRSAKKHFPEEFKRTGSVGGQMGYVVGTKAAKA